MEGRVLETQRQNAEIGRASSKGGVGSGVMVSSRGRKPSVMHRSLPGRTVVGGGIALKRGSKIRILKHDLTYMQEGRTVASQEVLQHAQGLTVTLRSAIVATATERDEIRVALERERRHVELLKEDNAARHAELRRALDIYRGRAAEEVHAGPSMEQIRELADAVQKAALTLKARTPQDRQEDSGLTLAIADGGGGDSMGGLTTSIYAREDAQLRLDRVQDAEARLTSQIRDAKLGMEAERERETRLRKEGAELNGELDALVQRYAAEIAELDEKTATVLECKRRAMEA